MLNTLHRLKGAGLVVSVRGKSGGFRLARAAREITLADVVEAIDGPAPPPRDPERSALAALDEVVRRAWLAGREALARITLDQFTAEGEYSI